MTILLQRCSACGTINYPARSLCRNCLADALEETEDPGTGLLLAATLLHRSLEPAYAEALPLRIGTVLLDSGPHLPSFVADGVEPGGRVRLEPSANPLGEAVWRAVRMD